NKMIIRGLVLLLVVFGGYIYKQFSGEDLAELTREQVIVKGITTFVNYVHFSPHSMDDTYSQEVFDIYLESLDGRKQFFTAEEVDILRNNLVKLDDQIKTFDLTFFRESYDMYVQAFHRAEKMYKDILSRPFEYDVSENLERDPSKLDFPRDSTELRDYWRKLLKYETLGRIIDKQNAVLDGEDPLTFQELEKEAREGTREMYERYFEIGRASCREG